MQLQIVSDTRYNFSVVSESQTALVEEYPSNKNNVRDSSSTYRYQHNDAIL